MSNYNNKVKLLGLIYFIALSFLTIYSGNSQAIEFNDAVFPELATSGRALAMGNAFIARVDDSSAVFYNPAGLGSVRYGHFHFSNIHEEANKGWLSIAAGGLKSITIDGQRKLLNKEGNYGKLAYTRLHALPNFTTRYFSAGYLYSRQTLATIETSSSEFEYAQRTDNGPYAAFNISIFGGIFKVGFSGIILNRSEASGKVDKEVTVAKNPNKGTAFIVTGGAKLILPIAFLPTFAATIHNLGSQKFSLSTGTRAPVKIKQTFDLGFSITPQIGKTTRWHLELNYKDFSNKYGTSSSRRITFGTEFDFSRVTFIRFGWGDGFGSAGIGLRTKKLEFDLTTYAVDIAGVEDRRFSMSISTGF